MFAETTRQGDGNDLSTPPLDLQLGQLDDRVVIGVCDFETMS